MKRREILKCAAAAAASTISVPLLAQSNYPNKPIRLIVPYAAGGGGDTVARIISTPLGERLGQSVVVDNRPGANGVLAVQALTSAATDGYTLLLTDGSILSVNPLIYKSLKYDPKKDLVPVAQVARGPLFLAAHPKVAANSFAEFVALAHAKPGTLSYGTPGIGSTHHLCMESLKAALGVDIRHIPYKGAAQAIPALVSGEIDLTFAALPSLQGFVKSGQVKLIAVNSPARHSKAPNLPAIAESIPGFDFSSTMGIVAATGTPASAISRIAAEILQVAKAQSVLDAFQSVGLEVVALGTSDYGRAIQAEEERMSKAVQISKLQPE